MNNGHDATVAALPSPPPRRSKPSSTFHLFAGLASGLTTSLLLQPADLLKTRVQQSPSSSVSSVIRHIYSTPHPLAQLWRGTLPSAVRTGLGSALYFSILNKLRSSLAATRAATPTTRLTGSSALPKLSPGLNLVSGAAARAFAGFVMMPVTVLKVRFESSIYGYKSLRAALRDIVAERGLRGLFAGSGATALRDAPYAGLYVVLYEWSKGALGSLSTAGRGQDRMHAGTSATINFASGGLAAAAATAATNPPDAVKTRLQLMPAKYKNSLQAASLMLKEEGLRSMFDGLGLRMARKALSSALAWTVYEEVVRRAESKLYQ